MTWSALALPLLVTVALMFGAGLPPAWALGLRGFTAAAIAPGFGLGFVGVTAVLVHPLGLGWSWWIPALGAALLTGTILLARHWLPTASGLLVATGPGWRGDAASWCGALTGWVVGLVILARVLGGPAAFSQTFDNMFHLGTTRTIIDTGIASSLVLNGALNEPIMTGFYPAAFHDLAALASLMDPHRLTLGMNAVVTLAVAVLWPLSTVYAVRSLVSRAPAALVGAGLLSGALPAFPLLLLDFGVLYPNLLGLSLAPVALALVGQLLRLARHVEVATTQAILSGMLLLPGLFLAHPNVVMTVALISAPWLLTRAFRILRTVTSPGGRAPWVELALTLAAFAAIVLVWPWARPGEAPWDPLMALPDAVGRYVLNMRPDSVPVWAVSALAALGALAAANRRQLWLVASSFVVGCFWVVVASFPADAFRTSLTGIWYNDPYRFAALVPLTTIPLAALALAAVHEHTARRCTVDPAGAQRWGAAAAAALPLTVCGLAGWLVLSEPALHNAVDQAASRYRLTADSPLVDRDEMTLLQRLPQHVGPDDVVATNPWNGSGMAYAFAGVRTTTKHAFYEPSTELTVVNDHLDEAARNPQVCPAVRALGVTFVLDFGMQEINEGSNPYRGFLDLEGAPGFRLVDHEGDARLYQVTACP